jgi:Asp-tRNA(Asn)/Glu-tRNA(Gln) amidotransferase A subunit family amidase
MKKTVCAPSGQPASVFVNIQGGRKCGALLWWRPAVDVRIQAAPNELTASEIVAAVGSGRLTCESVVRACLDRIAAREPDVQAWASLAPDQALAAAREIDRHGARGPLAGVPFGVKDIIDTADLPTEWGTPIHRGRRPNRDAACVALARKAGGILLGKTVTTEFANLHPGPTRNPHDLARTPGGSSSGSAAAVADHMVPIALGTQTTGSTIRPASFCGVFGYRPTYGVHRLHGVMEASGSLDTLGILARSLEDIALYRDALLGVPPEPIAPQERPPRVALCRSHNWDQIEPSTRALIEEAAQTLGRAGARVSDLTLPQHFARLNEAHRWISSFEFARTFTWEIEHHWDEISETLRTGRLADGLSCPEERYVAMLDLAEQCRREIESIWDDHDVILTAAAYGEAPAGQPAFAGAPLYMMWTVLHLPTVTVPVFRGPNGLPVGAQVLARRHADRKLFACARWIHHRLT